MKGAVNTVAIPFVLEGTAMEIAAQLFDRMVAPALEAAHGHLPAPAVLELYVGLLLNTGTGMAAQMGGPAAAEQFRFLADQVERMPPTPSTFTH